MEFNNQNEERKVITAEEFLELITENGILEGYQVDGTLLLDGSKFQTNITHFDFYNCDFHTIKLNNIDGDTQIAFSSCTIQNIISGYSKEGNTVRPTSFKLSILQTDLKKISCLNYPSVEFDFSDSTIGDLYVNNCYLTTFYSKDTLYKNKLLIRESSLDLLLLNNCIFEESVIIREASVITNLLSLEQCHFNGGFLFDLNEKTNCNLVIRIESCKTDHQLVFFGKNSSIKHFYTHRFKGSLEMYDLTIRTTEILSSYEKDASYRFSSCLFNNFSSRGINSTFHLSTIKSFGDQSTFEIRSSDLNNASLFDVNLQSFDTVVIEKSDFTNMTTSRVTWFEDKKLKTAFQSENEDPYERREFYRQLKYNQEKQGNKIQALTFQSLEMQYYSLELSPKFLLPLRVWKNKIKTYITDQFPIYISIQKGIALFQNRFVLWIGKLNNHGQSFLKPLLLLLGLGLIFNFLILQSASPQSTLELLFKKGSLKMLPSLLNPVHDISKLLHIEEPSFWTGFLDLIWKVIETTLIFQTITAFRKHVRV